MFAVSLLPASVRFLSCRAIAPVAVKASLPKVREFVPLASRDLNFLLAMVTSLPSTFTSVAATASASLSLTLAVPSAAVAVSWSMVDATPAVSLPMLIVSAVTFNDAAVAPNFLTKEPVTVAFSPVMLTLPEILFSSCKLTDWPSRVAVPSREESATLIVEPPPCRLLSPFKVEPVTVIVLPSMVLVPSKTELSVMLTALPSISVFPVRFALSIDTLFKALIDLLPAMVAFVTCAFTAFTSASTPVPIVVELSAAKLTSSPYIWVLPSDSVPSMVTSLLSETLYLSASILLAAAKVTSPVLLATLLVPATAMLPPLISTSPLAEIVALVMPILFVEPAPVPPVHAPKAPLSSAKVPARRLTLPLFEVTFTDLSVSPKTIFWVLLTIISSLALRFPAIYISPPVLLSLMEELVAVRLSAIRIDLLARLMPCVSVTVNSP